VRPLPAGTEGIDPLELESALLESAPHPARSRAMHRWSLLRQLLTTADLVAGLATGVVTAVALGLGGFAHLGFIAATGVLWLGLCFGSGLSARADLRTWASGVPDVARLLTTAVLISWLLVGLAVLFGAGFRPAVATAATALALGSGLLRALVRAFVHRLAPLRQRTLIVGSGVVAAQLADALRRHNEVGLEAVGIVDDEVFEVEGLDLPWLGGVEDLPRVLRDQAVDRVIFAFSRTGHDELLGGLRVCRDAGVAIDVVPRLFEFLDGAQALDGVGGLPLLSIGVPQLGRASQTAKRALDVAVAGAALVVLSPVLLAIAAAIKLSSRGPVFFRQPRAGRNGETFLVWKFRSMYADAEARKAELAAANEHGDGLMFKIAGDPRITPVGRFIRRTSLDELPQLINVVVGEMSLVGPRPLIHAEADHLIEDWHVKRLDLRPGITGLWQISGRSDVSFREMVRLDYQYVAGWSVARDIEILLATLPAVLGARGAY
jgi:exopolysaccharide biosynthesis polyprenyl glycosylphosphotransferase